MTKRDLVVRISSETGLIQEDVYAVIQKTLDCITEALGKGDHIELREFGVFDVCVRKARIGRNPNKPENTVRIPERKVVKFKAGKRMKETIAAFGAPASDVA
ncbi:MAG: integration host factor subunit beta [Lentisphaerae bacterium]|nr:integration host factor subunit beta [Lentisphaerota bacterium]